MCTNNYFRGYQSIISLCLPIDGRDHPSEDELLLNYILWVDSSTWRLLSFGWMDLDVNVFWCCVLPVYLRVWNLTAFVLCVARFPGHTQVVNVMATLLFFGLPSNCLRSEKKNGRFCLLQVWIPKKLVSRAWENEALFKFKKKISALISQILSYLDALLATCSVDGIVWFM
jgi:hypothetical protein